MLQDSTRVNRPLEVRGDDQGFLAAGFLSQGIATDSAVRSSLRVEVPALVAPVIHLTSKESRYDPAQDEDPSKHRYGQQSVGETLHGLSIAARPLVEIA